MRYLISALVSALLVSALFAQSKVIVSPNAGSPGIPFIVVSTDTPVALPATSPIDGIKDTTGGSGNPIVANWCEVYAQGNDGVRWCYRGYPTRYHQIYQAITAVAVDSGARGTFIPITSCQFKDSMRVNIYGAGLSYYNKTPWFITKAYSGGILVKVAYNTEGASLSGDSVSTAAWGERIYSGSTKTLFVPFLPYFHYESWTALKPDTLTIQQGRQ